MEYKYVYDASDVIKYLDEAVADGLPSLLMKFETPELGALEMSMYFSYSGNDAMDGYTGSITFNVTRITIRDISQIPESGFLYTSVDYFRNFEDLIKTLRKLINDFSDYTWKTVQKLMSPNVVGEVATLLTDMLDDLKLLLPKSIHDLGRVSPDINFFYKKYTDGLYKFFHKPQSLPFTIFNLVSKSMGSVTWLFADVEDTMSSYNSNSSPKVLNGLHASVNNSIEKAITYTENRLIIFG